MSQMTAVQINSPGGPFEVIKRPVPEPGPNKVRIKIEACGVCHSDAFVKEGHWPGLAYPRVTGHEVAGVIDAVGRASTIGRRGSGSAWDGMAVTVASVCHADGETSWAARISR